MRPTLVAACDRLAERTRTLCSVNERYQTVLQRCLVQSAAWSRSTWSSGNIPCFAVCTGPAKQGRQDRRGRDRDSRVGTCSGGLEILFGNQPTTTVNVSPADVGCQAEVLYSLPCSVKKNLRSNLKLCLCSF